MPSFPSNLITRGVLERRSRGLLSQVPTDYTWAFDGTCAGTTDADGNTPVDTLTNLSPLGGGPVFSSSGLVSTQKMKSIPQDFTVAGRRSLLLANSVVNGRKQYLYDTVTNNSFWYDLLRYELMPGVGGTLVIVHMPRTQETGVVFGNFMGSTSGGPGLLYEWESANRRMNMYTFKQNAFLSTATSAIGSAPAGSICTCIHVSKKTGGAGGRGSFESRVNGVSVASGSTVANAAVEAITNRFTIGARADGDGANSAYGGQILFGLYYPRALSASEITQIESAITAWYTRQTLAPTTAPLAGVSVLDSIDYMEAGTSIEFGYNDEAENGAIGYITTELAPMEDLAIEVIGAVAGNVVDMVAYSGGTVRGGGSGAATGLDPRSPDHANRWDHQFATMNAAGKFAVGRKLVIAIPSWWFNDLNAVFGFAGTYDAGGDGLRLCDRIVSDIRGVDPAHDIRFIVMTTTPENLTVGGTLETEIALMRASTQDWANELARRTGCPVGICDVFAIINSNIAAFLAAGTSGGGDNIHPSPAGHRAKANGVVGVKGLKDVIRYVCGLAA